MHKFYLEHCIPYFNHKQANVIIIIHHPNLPVFLSSNIYIESITFPITVNSEPRQLRHLYYPCVNNYSKNLPSIMQEPMYTIHYQSTKQQFVRIPA